MEENNRLNVNVTPQELVHLLTEAKSEHMRLGEPADKHDWRDWYGHFLFLRLKGVKQENAAILAALVLTQPSLYESIR